MQKLITTLCLLSLSAHAQNDDTCQWPVAAECEDLCVFLGGAHAVPGVDPRYTVRLFGWLDGTLDANDCTMDAACYHTAEECRLTAEHIGHAIIEGGCLHFPQRCLMDAAMCLMNNPTDWCY